MSVPKPKRISRFNLTNPNITVTMNDGGVFRHSLRTGDLLQVAQRPPYVAKPAPKNGSQSLPP